MTDPSTTSPQGSHSLPPEPIRPEALRAIDAAVGKLRVEAEAAEATASARARLWLEVAEVEERVRDEQGAMRDYLEALTADAELRESAEALIRIFERRRSFKQMARVVDALASAAMTPDDRVRAKVLRGQWVADPAGDTKGAYAAFEEAAREEGASAPEVGAALVLAELFAAKAGDTQGRADALAQRAKSAGDPTWRALLLVDAARLVGADGRDAEALELVTEALALCSGATEGERPAYVAAHRAETVLREISARTSDATKLRAHLALSSSLELQGRAIARAIDDGARGDEEGVPHHARTPAHFAHALLRAAEVLREAGDAGRAGRLVDDALAHPSIGRDATVRARLLSARVRFAEEVGDTALASKLAAERLGVEEDPGVRASLSLRIAEHAASVGDGEGAQRALAQAAEADRTSVPARALALDLAATGGEPAQFAGQLESLARELPTDAAAARALLYAAVVWAIEARDESNAKAALAEAAERGASPKVVGELARALASVVGSATWYDEGTKRLAAAGGDEPADVKTTRAVEMIRTRLLRGDSAGATKLLESLGDGGEAGAWLGALLASFVPAAQDAPIPSEARTRALDRLASLEERADVRAGLALLAARIVHRAGDVAAAAERLRKLMDDTDGDPLVAVMLSEVERSLGRGKEAAGVLRRAATGATRELAAAFELEAGFLAWDVGDKRGAIEAFDGAAEHAPELAVLARAWAGRGIAVGDRAARTRAIEDSETSGEHAALVALERVGVALAARDAATVTSALEALEDSGDGDLATAAALARLVLPNGSVDEDRFARAAARLGALSERTESLAAAELFALARQTGGRAAIDAASRWFDVGGGVNAGLEWLGAAMSVADPKEEARARRAIGRALGGETREALEASAALVESIAKVRRPNAPPVAGASEAVRLANLELGPPGADPRRREHGLRNLGTALGDDARVDAIALSGWSLLAMGDATRAARVFEHVATVRPSDISAWEGLRTASGALGDLERRAIAATAIGKRCVDRARGAAFHEEAGLTHLERGNEDDAEGAFAAAFDADPSRPVAFDKLFRRVRERRDGNRLLEVIRKRLEVSDEPSEISKLFWEQARVLREKGDVDGALKALENVTMIEPEHVGALALTGEIFIRRGQFDEAATKLAALASLREAPAKNRLTAGIAAVDLYENKLDRFDRALDVLIDLHKSGLSTLPVRERLARAAARTGAWNEAISILEQLMQERAEPSGRIEAARLAMAIHRDRLHAPEKAVAPVLRLLEEAPSDGEAIDMLLGLELPAAQKRELLTKTRGVLLTALRLNPIDVANADRLVRIAQAIGDEETLAVALSVSAAFGNASSQSALAASMQRRPSAPEVTMTDDRFAALLAPGDEGPLATLFAFLAPTLAEALGPSLTALGVTKRDKVDPKSGLALRNEIAAWAGAFGIPTFDLYIGGRDAAAVQGVPGEVPSLVVGPEVHAPLDARAKARIARELLGLVRGTTVLRLRDDTTVAAIVVAACHLVDVPIEAPAYAVLGEVEKAMGKAMPRKLKKTLHDVCREIADQKPDARDYRRRALASQARAAVVASADVAFVLSEMLEGALERVQGSVRADERATELLRFVLSPTYTELRRSLGLERP